MKIGELPLPPKVTARGHFNTTYAQTQRAAELLIQKENETFPDDVTLDQVNELLRLQQAAICATTALKNLLVGNPVPRRGE